ncbi:hypothetical protein ACFWB2_31865 [Streptomyces virginiae]|uniref:hypothetical protein n=1 Tax=Streptomyces virginiae TaxID=1961 RepID=UPI0036765902
MTSTPAAHPSAQNYVTLSDAQRAIVQRAAWGLLRVSYVSYMPGTTSDAVDHYSREVDVRITGIKGERRGAARKDSVEKLIREGLLERSFRAGVVRVTEAGRCALDGRPVPVPVAVPKPAPVAPEVAPPRSAIAEKAPEERTAAQWNGLQRAAEKVVAEEQGHQPRRVPFESTDVREAFTSADGGLSFSLFRLPDDCESETLLEERAKRVADFEKAVAKRDKGKPEWKSFGKGHVKLKPRKAPKQDRTPADVLKAWSEEVTHEVMCNRCDGGFDCVCREDISAVLADMGGPVVDADAVASGRARRSGINEITVRHECAAQLTMGEDMPDVVEVEPQRAWQVGDVVELGDGTEARVREVDGINGTLRVAFNGAVVGTAVVPDDAVEFVRAYAPEPVVEALVPAYDSPEHVTEVRAVEGGYVPACACGWVQDAKPMQEEEWARGRAASHRDNPFFDMGEPNPNASVVLLPEGIPGAMSRYTRVLELHGAAAVVATSAHRGGRRVAVAKLTPVEVPHLYLPGDRPYYGAQWVNVDHMPDAHTVVTSGGRRVRTSNLTPAEDMPEVSKEVLGDGWERRTVLGEEYQAIRLSDDVTSARRDRVNINVAGLILDASGEIVGRTHGMPDTDDIYWSAAHPGVLGRNVAGYVSIGGPRIKHVMPLTEEERALIAAGPQPTAAEVAKAQPVHVPRQEGRKVSCTVAVLGHGRFEIGLGAATARVIAWTIAPDGEGWRVTDENGAVIGEHVLNGLTVDSSKKEATAPVKAALEQTLRDAYAARGDAPKAPAEPVVEAGPWGAYERGQIVTVDGAEGQWCLMARGQNHGAWQAEPATWEGGERREFKVSELTAKTWPEGAEDWQKPVDAAGRELRIGDLVVQDFFEQTTVREVTRVFQNGNWLAHSVQVGADGSRNEFTEQANRLRVVTREQLAAHVDIDLEDCGRQGRIVSALASNRAGQFRVVCTCGDHFEWEEVTELGHSRKIAWRKTLEEARALWAEHCRTHVQDDAEEAKARAACEAAGVDYDKGRRLHGHSANIMQNTAPKSSAGHFGEWWVNCSCPGTIGGIISNPGGDSWCKTYAGAVLLWLSHVAEHQAEDTAETGAPVGAETAEISGEDSPAGGGSVEMEEAAESVVEEGECSHRYVWLSILDTAAPEVRTALTCACGGERLGMRGKSRKTAWVIADRNGYDVAEHWERVSPGEVRAAVTWRARKEVPTMAELLEKHVGADWTPITATTDPEFEEEPEEAPAPAQGPLTRKERRAAWRLAAGEATPEVSVTPLDHCGVAVSLGRGAAFVSLTEPDPVAVWEGEGGQAEDVEALSVPEPRGWFAPVVAPAPAVEETGPDYAEISSANRSAAVADVVVEEDQEEPQVDQDAPALTWAQVSAGLDELWALLDAEREELGDAARPVRTFEEVMEEIRLERAEIAGPEVVPVPITTGVPVRLRRDLMSLAASTALVTMLGASVAEVVSPRV